MIKLRLFFIDVKVFIEFTWHMFNCIVRHYHEFEELKEHISEVTGGNPKIRTIDKGEYCKHCRVQKFKVNEHIMCRCHMVEE